jgi:hypothetical protein
MKKDQLQPIDIEEVVINNDQYKSWLIKVEGEDYWFSKSICELEEEQSVIFIPLWLCEKKGIL